MVVTPRHERSLQRGLEHVSAHNRPKIDKRPSRVRRRHTVHRRRVATQQVTGPMGDERAAVVSSRIDGDFRTRRPSVDETQQVRRTAMRSDATGRQRRGLKPHCIVQRSSSNEIDTAMQHDQPPAIHTVTDLMVSEPDFRGVADV